MEYVSLDDSEDGEKMRLVLWRYLKYLQHRTHFSFEQENGMRHGHYFISREILASIDWYVNCGPVLGRM